MTALQSAYSYGTRIALQTVLVPPAGWGFEVCKMAVAVAIGVLIGASFASRRRQQKDLLVCYTSYFSNVLSVALAGDVTGAEARLASLTRASHELELLESDGACVMATGMLFARCHTLVSLLAEGAPAAGIQVARLRREVSEHYADALTLVRRRLGSRPFA